jgi:hypothetical protein
MVLRPANGLYYVNPLGNLPLGVQQYSVRAHDDEAF